MKRYLQTWMTAATMILACYFGIAVSTASAVGAANAWKNGEVVAHTNFGCCINGEYAKCVNCNNNATSCGIQSWINFSTGKTVNAPVCNYD